MRYDLNFRLILQAFTAKFRFKQKRRETAQFIREDSPAKQKRSETAESPAKQKRRERAELIAHFNAEVDQRRSVADEVRFIFLINLTSFYS